MKYSDPFDGLGDFMISEDAIDAFDWRLEQLLIEIEEWLSALVAVTC